ncbi:MAG: B12-binding domain-containing radical SAM protein [Deltaproteobacteria bacterium]|nr:B12-binding domain-containing radical SAM protein [Deltaproteobacteria bacterium]
MNLITSGNKKKHALLIFPRPKGSRTSNDAFFPFPFLGLTQVAASLSAHFNVRIVDERISHISGKEKTDIVFITALTSTVYRAYFLADIFRKREIPVIMGGIHATVLPEEASRHATSVVIGEAEDIIDTIISDYENGMLAPAYRRPCRPELDSIPCPDLGLLNWRHRAFLSPIQTSRGCPNNCNFCSVPAVSGRKLRLKSVSTIEKELNALSRFRSRNLFVVDDNFTVMKDRAMAIMDIFRFYGFRWMGFSNLWVCEDREFLQAMQKSRCASLFIGFESLNNQGHLSKNRSYQSPESIRDAADRIHAYKIGIHGSFIFGFDEDRADVFQNTVSLIQDSGIELPNINILTPFPGTPLFDSMERENRFIHKDWSRYDMSHTVFRPANMSPEELQQGYAWALKYLSSPTSIMSRLKKGIGNIPYFLLANFSLHRQQTSLARSLWNPEVQRFMQKRGLCLC